MKRMTWLRRSGLLLLLLALLSSAWGSAAFAETEEQVREVRELLETYHLSKPDDEELARGEIDGMIDALNDPYTDYYDDGEWKQFLDSLEKTFVGIGIVMSENEGSVFIEEVIPDSPAEKAGLHPGDELLAADGEELSGKSLEEVHATLQDEAGTTLVLEVSRGGKALKFRIVRQALQLPTASARMMGDGVGYLALTSFSSNAYEEFKSKLESLEKNGLSSLVVDLRNNGGGYVNEAQEIAGLFVKEGLLATMKDRDSNEVALSVQGGEKPYPVWILVNPGTASASELLAGALQDYGKAKLIGDTTFGKGVVQSLLPVSNGGYLKVTIQEYYTPKGRKVDKIGLRPDVLAEGAAVQLATAFRAAGGRTLSVVSGKGSVTVNGIKAAQPSAAFKRDGAWYVNVRLASAMLGADIGYEGKTKSVVLTRDGVKRAVRIGDPKVFLQNGKSAIDVTLLEKWFGDFDWKASGESVTLTASAPSANTK